MMAALTEIRGSRLVEIHDVLAFIDFILPLFHGRNAIFNLSEDSKALWFSQALAFCRIWSLQIENVSGFILGNMTPSLAVSHFQVF